MRVPNNIVSDISLSCLNDFCICRFKDKEHSASAPSHRYIVCPTVDADEFIFCIITSQIDKKVAYYSNRYSHKEECSRSLIYLYPVDFACITKNCVVDCNSARNLTINKLKENIIDYSEDPAFHIIESNIPEDFKQRISRGILQSPTVKQSLKRIIHYTAGSG